MQIKVSSWSYFLFLMDFVGSSPVLYGFGSREMIWIWINNTDYSLPVDKELSQGHPLRPLLCLLEQQFAAHLSILSRVGRLTQGL